MMDFETHSDYSLVTAILPRQSTSTVLGALFASGARGAMTLSARGTVMQDRWYQTFLPAISPEQEMIYLIVPNSEVDHLMEQIVMVGKLTLYGAGSIFASPCDAMTCSKDYPLWTEGRYTFESVSFDIQFKENLIALTHIIDRDAAEPIARAALKAGAQAATINYMRGYGLRDRLGLLRITKSHEKELITVVVDPYDLDAVFQAMAQEGKVDQPGRGILYQTPVSKGLTNLASVFQAKKQSASMQQIVRAIDELQGGTDWRAKQLLIHHPRAAEFESENRGVSRNVTLLNVLSHRKDAESLLQVLLHHGIAGASASNWRLTEAGGEETRGGQRINREFGCLSLVLAPEKVDEIQTLLQETIAEREMKETCFFSHPVPIAKSFATLREKEAAAES